MRKASQADAQLLWKWVNDPLVRYSAFEIDYIPWNAHLEWFHKKLKDNKTEIYIFEDDSGLPVGQVRFDRKVKSALIDIHLSPEQRGKGMGALMLRYACDEYQKFHQGTRLVAWIKPANQASLKSFIRAGFSVQQKGKFKGQAALRLTRS